MKKPLLKPLDGWSWSSTWALTFLRKNGISYSEWYLWYRVRWGWLLVEYVFLHAWTYWKDACCFNFQAEAISRAQVIVIFAHFFLTVSATATPAAHSSQIQTKRCWSIFYLVHEDSRTPLVMVRWWSSVDLQCLAVVNQWIYYIDLDSHHGNGLKWDSINKGEWFCEIAISKMLEKYSWIWFSGCVFGSDGMVIGGSGRGRSEFWELLVNFQQYFGYLLR